MDESIVIRKTDTIQSGSQDNFGSTLLKAAKESYQIDKQQLALNAAKELLIIRDRALTMISRWNEIVEFNNAKIDALEKGEFEYELVTGRIIFKKDKLNESWTTAEVIR